MDRAGLRGRHGAVTKACCPAVNWAGSCALFHTPHTKGGSVSWGKLTSSGYKTRMVVYSVIMRSRVATELRTLQVHVSGTFTPQGRHV